MDPYQLADDAIADIDAVWLYLLEREGVETADRIVTEFFKSFYHLADSPAIGHRRPDLTERDVLFYKVFSYLVIYRPVPAPLQILGVIHGKRDLARILRARI